MVGTMIEVRDLTKQYGSVGALRGVSFSVPRGQVVGLLGPNGAGKTTAMRILTGYVAPTSGTAAVDGRDVVEESMACRRRIGYLPEGNPLYFDLRVDEALAFAARMHGLGRAERPGAIARSVEAAGLPGVTRRLIAHLSKGYRQRLGLAMALLHDPDVLVLDEPTSGLDPNQQEEMRDLIRRLGEEHTVLISTHIRPEVEAVCDRALIIHQGQLVEDGSIPEIKQKQLGEATATLTVRGEASVAREAYTGLPFVRDVGVESVVGEDGVVQVRVALREPPGRELLERLARVAVEKGLPLSGLATEAASLERVFAQLTSEAAAPLEVVDVTDAVPAAATGTEES